MYTLENLNQRLYKYILEKMYKINDVFFIFPEDETDEEELCYYLRVSDYQINIVDYSDDICKVVVIDNDVINSEKGAEYISHVVNYIIAIINMSLIETEYKHNSARNKLLKQLTQLSGDVIDE